MPWNLPLMWNLIRNTGFGFEPQIGGQLIKKGLSNRISHIGPIADTNTGRRHNHGYEKPSTCVLKENSAISSFGN